MQPDYIAKYNEIALKKSNHRNRKPNAYLIYLKVFYCLNSKFQKLFKLFLKQDTSSFPLLSLNNESNKIQKESEPHEEFKRLLFKQIPKKDKIWSDGDKFEIEKFLEEPYLGKVNKITSNHAKKFLVFLKSCSQLI